MNKIIYIEENEVRLDVYLSEILTHLSRSQIQTFIKDGSILVNDNKSKVSYRLKLDDVITYPDIEIEEFELSPIDYPLDIVYEDDSVIIINKEAGIVVYPGVGKEEVSVVSALLGLNKQLYESEDKLRPGIVHRLDKDTSGLMVLVKNQKAYDSLVDQFKERSAIRKYYALVFGSVEHNFATIDAPIGRDENNRIKMAVSDNGKAAKTYFKLLESSLKYSLLECELESGRTHQIRVHMNFINHPIINDPLYGNKASKLSNNLMLQSYYLQFKHPETNEDISFTLDIREDFKLLLEEVE